MKNTILLILFLLFSRTVLSQNYYTVLLLDSIPSLKQYVITLKKGRREFIVLSEYNIDSSQLFLKKDIIIISKGIKLKLHLIKINENEKPFVDLFKKIRNGLNPIYINGKKYDPKTHYYYSKCIKSLFYCKSAKC